MHSVKLTANFERNLQEIETFLLEAQAPHAFDALLDELTGTVLPNLESFPGLGRLFLERPLGKNGELREYVMTHYLLLYARINGVVYLLSIRHQRQLSFDFQALWPAP